VLRSLLFKHVEPTNRSTKCVDRPIRPLRGSKRAEGHRLVIAAASFKRVSPNDFGTGCAEAYESTGAFGRDVGHQVQAIAAAADLEPLVTELRSRKNKRDEQEASIAA